MASGFTLSNIADHLRCSKKQALEISIAAGVKRRVKYLQGEDLDGTGKPLYFPFSQQETERILQEAFRRRGAALEEKLKRGPRKGPKHLRGHRRAPVDD